MKRNTPEHWKTELLMEKLNVCLAQAVGHLELLFHLTAKQSPRGDIGKMPNTIIARKCGWQGDPDTFIQALVECKWLDENSFYRLLVHDWEDHADDSVKKALKAKELQVITGKEDITYENASGKIPESSGKIPENSGLPCLALPSLALPSLALPLEAKEGSDAKEKAKAEAICNMYGIRRYKQYWKGLTDSPQCRKDVNVLKERIRCIPSAEALLTGYFTNPPPGRNQNEKLWEILEYLKLDKLPSAPVKTAYKDFTAERLAAQMGVG